MQGGYEIVDADDAGRAWIGARIEAAWGGLPVVSQGGARDPLTLPAIIAIRNGTRAGHATYRIEGPDCELFTLEAEDQWHGAGTALLVAVERRARDAGCTRLWLNTTNDNLNALRFYQRRGFVLTAVHAGLADHHRATVKPQMSKIGSFAIPIRDLLELEKSL